MGEALYRSLEGGSLAALVPNAGPLQLSGHWSLVLEQARSLRGSYVCQDMSGKEFPWNSLAGSGPFRSWRPDFEPARSSSDRGAKKPKWISFFPITLFCSFSFLWQFRFRTQTGVCDDSWWLPKGGDSLWKVQLSLVIHASPDFGCKLQAGRRQYIFLFCLALEWHLCKSWLVNICQCWSVSVASTMLSHMKSWICRLVSPNFWIPANVPLDSLGVCLPTWHGCWNR